MKQTLEEAAHSFAESRSSGSAFPAYYQGFIAGAEWQKDISSAKWLSKQSPWISVEERLPEYSCWVLVAGKNYKYRILFYCGGKFYTNKSLIAYDGSVLFWMFIPSFDQILEANKDVLQRLK